MRTRNSKAPSKSSASGFFFQSTVGLDTEYLPRQGGSTAHYTALAVEGSAWVCLWPGGIYTKTMKTAQQLQADAAASAHPAQRAGFLSLKYSLEKNKAGWVGLFADD